MRAELVDQIVRDRRGVSAIVVALGLTTMLGFAGLAIDVSLWYADKRAAQGAADSAAYSAAIDYMNNPSTTYGTATAKAVAAKYGFVSGSGGVTVTVNSPPLSGTHKTTGAFEVIIQKTESLAFTRSFISSAKVAARAVATPGSAGGDECVLALDPGSNTTTSFKGNPFVDLSLCGLQVNGKGSSAVAVTGSATLKAKYINVVGGISQGGSSTLTVTNKNLGAVALPNPYANLSVATAEADSSLTGAKTCAQGGTSYSGGNLSPGYYCSGLSLNGGTVNMSPGVYVISGGSMSVNGNVTINGTGVTVVLTGTTGNYATITVNGGAILNLTAPTTGALAGILFFGDPAAPSTSESDFLGGAAQSLTGVLDFPSQTLGYAGNSTTATCTELIGYDITFKGTTALKNTCAGRGTKAIGSSASSIVE
ncbi:MAG TPA: pilus assembly protein TadG-related protein [Caulobacteraceae bacterium]|jgi:Flp pilus assembly protein TadG|nr:pilus assembly protein TadG-related protein [Caulobacteraceae bacterium]